MIRFGKKFTIVVNEEDNVTTVIYYKDLSEVSVRGSWPVLNIYLDSTVKISYVVDLNP